MKAHISLLFSLILIGSGILGYMKKGSVMSGVMGGGLGLLGVFMSINILTAAEAEISNAWVRRMVVLCIFVALLMGYRFLKTGAFYPAGLVFLLGSLTAGLMILL